MRYVHHKFMILLVFALGLVVCLAGTAYAANPWQTTVSRAPVTYSLRHGPAAGAVHQANATVEVHSNFYSPTSVTIKAGETVTWNHVEGFHNVLANDGSFRLGEAPNGAPGTSWLTASHTFTQTGTFKYHCEVHGLGMSGEVIVQANDEPITSVVAINNGPTLLHDATNFTATVTGGTNVSYTWNFGDGKSSTGITTTHSYAATGSYTATVTATNNNNSKTASTVVQVTNQIVNVTNFAFTPISVTIKVGDTVTWVRKQGSHNVAADDGSFRLGEPLTNNPGTSWTTVSHKFTQPGTIPYHCDQHPTMMGVVHVEENPITGLAITNDSPTLLGNATHLTAAIASGTNVSYTWNFGDGKSGTGIATSHIYTPTGAYTVTLTATNSKGSQTASTVVQITNKIVQVADFSFTPSSVTVNVGDTVTWVRKQGFHNVDANDSSFRLGEASTHNPGSTWTTVSHQFTQAGTVTYHCDQHSSMIGTVIVQASSSSTQANYLPFVLK